MLRPITTAGYYFEKDCSVKEFAALLQDCQNRGYRPLYTTTTENHIPVYDCTKLPLLLSDKQTILTEWSSILKEGAGIIILQRAYEDTTVIDQATAVFNQIIAAEKETTAGDHFAQSGANDRIWNAHEKLCIRNPAVFAHYYANNHLDAVFEAWLGPHYQVTAQVNQVRPGGKAQRPHRDYHLGFQSVSQAEQFPAVVHLLSQFLTIQGAIAHSDMPIASGPTKMLPFSQCYLPGYVAWRRQDFIDYFEQHYVQYPLRKGDALFFNPAVFHAAGENTHSDFFRMANLIQVSSAYGRSMEKLDRVAMCKRLYPVLSQLVREGALSAKRTDCVIKACAEGYSFPTNLDTDPPSGELSPQSQADLLRQALDENWSASAFSQQIDLQKNRCWGIST